MKKSGFLIIIAGPSGVGKGTVRKEIMKNKKLNLVFSISLTTRAIRKGEKNGVDYYFVSEKKFKDAIKKHDLIEYNKYVGHYYGTSKSQVERALKAGKNVVLEIDVNGTKNILKSFDKKDVLSFFIVAPSVKELEKRIRGRSTESDKDIKGRLKKAKDEMKLRDTFDYVVVNDSPIRASKAMAKVIKDAMALRG